MYGSAIFLSAFLLFLIEPIAAKELLPILGGSSAVWITCLVFFQAALLLGYLYAHGMARGGLGGRWRGVHLAVLALSLVVLAGTAYSRVDFSGGTGHPVTTIFLALGLSIGVPFLILGSTSPLLQVWLSRSDEGKVSYGLFALSNAGSLLALVAYPFLIEPHVSLKVQKEVWSAGYVAFAVLSAWLAVGAKGRSEAVPEPDGIGMSVARSSVATKWLWFLLPMGAAMQLSAVTSHLTVNVAAIPLLWMLPLAAYLISFIVAFEVPWLYRRGIAVRLLVLMLASLGYALSKTDVSLPIGLGIVFFVVECFVACLFCHCEVYRLRPQSTSETTLFYLLIAAGGVAGTFFIGIASPLIFEANYDLALSFLMTALLALAVTWSDGWGQRLLWLTGSGLLLVLVFMLHTVYRREAMLEVRNFYGTLRVKQNYADPQGFATRMLLNGTIQHGTQWFGPGMSKVPTTYYAEDSGVG
jgi:hypothetical protein